MCVAIVGHLTGGAHDPIVGLSYVGETDNLSRMHTVKNGR